MNILLIPTTDNILNNIQENYEYFVDKKHKVYIICDTKFITRSTPEKFIKIDSYIYLCLLINGYTV